MRYDKAIGWRYRARLGKGPGPALGLWLALGIGLIVWPLAARSAPSDLCLTAARQVAAESEVPLSVLMAITLTETGRRQQGILQPWPWTINIEGEGHWFGSRQEALDFARQALATDRTSFDTGCFQINYRWHADHFASLESMFDPVDNARYAARFLSDLYRESGDWSVAAGAYHSRTRQYAERYRDRFDDLRAKAVADGADDGVLTLAATGATAAFLPRENTFPLLQRGTSGAARLGSLVPLSGGN